MLVFFIIAFAMIISSECATALTYGSFLKDRDVYDYIDEYDRFERNPYGENILGPAFDREDVFGTRNVKIFKDKRFISTIVFPILSKYYISGVGRIPRWSNAHRVVKNLYKTSKSRNHDS